MRDSKVIPMIRGKGTEYNAYLYVQKTLASQVWNVQKLNIAATPGTPDRDLDITHRRANITIKAEVKNAVRGKMTAGGRSRNHPGIPHFTVKCHRSRSHTTNVNNDRYTTDNFDLIITNPSNALFKGGTIGEEFEFVDDAKTVEMLRSYYQAKTNEELLIKTDQDWRFAFSADIADAAGVIPRTPAVYLKNDPHWFGPQELSARLDEWVKQKHQRR